VFYFKLYDDPMLAGYSVSEKNRIIHSAVKLSRKDYPVNLIKRLAILGGVVFLPAFLIYYFISLDAAISWTVAVTMIVSIKLNNIETPTIKPYLTQAIAMVTKKT